MDNSTSYIDRDNSMTGTGTGETAGLISSDKVEGTAVFNQQNERLGTIKNIMIDKVSGQARYAVMSFGGFLGMGEDHYPIPWNQLNYDTSAGGYRVNLNEEQLRDAPRYGGDTQPNYEPDYNSSIDRYYSQY
ncbi:MAG: PRC-barrel domain-containing protein [Sphingorhabdus sp.]